MKEFQRRRFLRNIVYSKITSFALLIVLVFVSYQTFNLYKKSRQAVWRNNKVEVELGKLNNRKDYLESEVARLNTDVGAEEELREKFQVAKPGEKVLIILDQKEDNQNDEKDADNKSFFKRFLGLF